LVAFTGSVKTFDRASRRSCGDSVVLHFSFPNDYDPPPFSPVVRSLK